jgi:hypothetical protein
MKPVELTAIDTNTAEWQLFPVEYINANLEHVPFVDDSETGMMVLRMVYRAGFTNPWHSHPCAHGIYVLEGTLDTHQGQYPAGGPERGGVRDQTGPEPLVGPCWVRNREANKGATHRGRALPSGRARAVAAR